MTRDEPSPPETLVIQSADGARTAASVYAHAKAGAPAIMIWPAMGVSARFYQAFAQELMRGAAVHVVTPDLRGIGASSVRASRAVDFGYREMAELDWPAAVAAVRKRFPASPIYLMGHSLGGQLNAIYAAREPQQLAGLIFVASGNVWYRGWGFPRNLGFLVFTQLSALIAAVVGHFPGKKLGFGGTEARTVMRDWARSARSGRYRPRGSSFDYETALGRVKLPLLGISFEHDDYAPHRAAENLLHKMPGAKITHLKLAATDTGGARIDHFSWARQSQAVVGRIASWLKEI